MRNKIKLDPVDLKQCQCEEIVGSFMTLGRPYYSRCKLRPVYIATEKKPGKNGIKGSMSLCEDCAKICINQMGIGYANFNRIKGV